MSSISLLSLLNGNNYALFNRSLAHKIGLNETIILSEIIDKYDYFHKENSLIEINDKHGWFYLTMDKIFERTALTAKQQRPAINKLIRLGFIEIKTYGQPSKRYFYINQQKLLELFVDDPNRDRHVESLNSKKESSNDKRSTLDFTEGKPYRCQKVNPINKEQDPRPKSPDLRKDSVSRKTSKDETLQPTRRFKLTDEQQGVVNWLKEHLKNTDENTLCYWAKTYEFAKIEAAFLQAKHMQASNVGAYMNRLLKLNISLESSDRKKCKELAENFIQAHNWNGCKIGNKYFTFSIGRSKMELPLDMDPEVFIDRLIEMYKKYKRQ